MAHIVFLRAAAAEHTAGKPARAGVPASPPRSAAPAANPSSPEAAVAVWRDGATPLAPHAATVVGLLSSPDVVAFIASHARGGGTAAEAMRTPAGDVVPREPALVREVEPDARLIEIMELMKQGAKRVLVRKNITEGCPINTQPFAPFYKAAPKITGTPRAAATQTMSRSWSSSTFGCDNHGYCHVDASSPAIEVVWRIPSDPRAVAVVRTNRDGSHVILGEISAHKLWKRDPVAAADAMARLSALHFATGIDENGAAPAAANGVGVGARRGEVENDIVPSPRSMRFSSRRIGFSACLASQMVPSHRKNTVLTCNSESSLAAVMAQMLAHRATHLWVVQGGDTEEAILVGMVGYMDIFNAVTSGVLVLPA
ncbi:hypothetical protein ZWY2020_048413 [Hordeum vulgare]|nr:hypothetical protein ZWY2020_048413 [Hordeum vulgare]